MWVTILISRVPESSVEAPQILLLCYCANWLPRWLSGKESACQCRRYKRCQFDPWVGKIPWRRKWQPTPVFLPGESHGQRSLVGYSPWGHRVRHDWVTEHTHTYAVITIILKTVARPGMGYLTTQLGHSSISTVAGEESALWDGGAPRL